MADTEAPTLTAWLLEQIAVDEALARGHARAVQMSIHIDSGGTKSSQRPVYVDDKKRMLAECAAKRAIVEEHANLGDMCRKCMHQTPYLEMSADMHPCPTLRALASVYADRPGWREEWR